VRCASIRGSGVIDGVVKLFDQRGGFIVQQLKMRHNLDMGLSRSPAQAGRASTNGPSHPAHAMPTHPRPTLGSVPRQPDQGGLTGQRGRTPPSIALRRASLSVVWPGSLRLRLRLGHVTAVLGLAVPAITGAVVDFTGGIDPDLTGAATGARSSALAGCGRRLRRCVGWAGRLAP